jgi:cysteine desulfurase/selenocysteine lyase
VAQSFGSRLRPSDEIIVSVLEHHSNLIPWQMVSEQTGAALKYVRLNDQESFDYDHFLSLLSCKTKIVAVAQVSNVLGVENPIRDICVAAHSAGAAVLVDSCQFAPHAPLDVQSLGADFVVFSGHKMCGPLGIGVLYGRRALLEALPARDGGGGMAERVDQNHFTASPLPHRFEAGTPNIAGAVGLAEACDYLDSISDSAGRRRGMVAVSQWSEYLGEYMYNQLQDNIPNIRIYGPPPSVSPRTAGIVSFSVRGLHSGDISGLLGDLDICVRSGKHCAQPLYDALNCDAREGGSVRASTYLYNTKEDVDILVDGVNKVCNKLR